MYSSIKSPTAWQLLPVQTLTRLPSWPAPSLAIPAIRVAVCRVSSPACSAEIPRKRCLRPPRKGTRSPPLVSNLRKRPVKRKASLARLDTRGRLRVPVRGGRRQRFLGISAEHAGEETLH